MSPATVGFGNLSYYRCVTNGSRLYSFNNSSISVSLLSVYAVSGRTANVAITRGTYCLQPAMPVTGSSNGDSGAAPSPRWSSFSSESLSISLIEECLPPLSWAFSYGIAGTGRRRIADTHRALFSASLSL